MEDRLGKATTRCHSSSPVDMEDLAAGLESTVRKA